MPQAKPTVLILGGYGVFGKKLSTILAQGPYKVIVAGRSKEKAEAFLTPIKRKFPQANVVAMAMDWHREDFAELLKQSQANILIHTAGPFQGQDYKVAKTCIELNIHYLDLSDGREFVTHIHELDDKAKAKGVMVISGASSVPGVSSAVVDHYAKKFGILREIHFGIAPANKIERGEAVLKAILGYTGKPFQRLEDGKWKTVYGWQDIHRQYFGDNVGLRWQANCDVPDLVLLPEKYPMLKTVAFYAGLEVSFLHLAMWAMSWLSRYKIIKNWANFSKLIHAMSRWFKNAGSDKGGMYVKLQGSSQRYQPLEITWLLVAEQGHGPYIPIIPCLILLEKLAKGFIAPGARSCFAEFNLEEFEEAIKLWSMYTTVEEKET
ncbi:MAG: saccharopine dehydrogenase NADP-binding domain-containing protein [Proteobacteria bacterium]|nr:saccharopine dehydrogenase NADP-binding domain-containing protein [Pseudomonadota bacterium]